MRFTEPPFDQDSTYGDIWEWFYRQHRGDRYTDRELHDIHVRWRRLGKLAQGPKRGGHRAAPPLPVREATR